MKFKLYIIPILILGFLPRMRSNPDKYSGFSDVKFSSIPDFLRGGAEYISHPLDTEVPENFDARKKWPECKSIQGIYAQGQCSSCWAVVTTSMLTDRTCIEFGGKENFEYSAEDLVTCCDDCSEGIHCKTGYPARALRYWIEEGIVSGGGIHSERGCMPYSNKSYYFKRDQKAEKTICGKTCTNSKFSGSYGKDKRFGKKMRVQVNTLGPSWNITDDAEKSSYKKAMAPLIKNIQIEIMLHGPVFAGGLMLTKDFINEYKAKEIYQYSGTADDLKDVGIHGVKIIGWGVENGVPYWLAANSWGTSWGDGGFFKILRGENHVQILNSVLASESLPRSSDAGVIKKSIFLLFSCFITLKGLL